MKIQLRNFGPIDFFEFDTKTQMHFIFGENNIGKSYAISAVYLILKNLLELDAQSFLLFDKEIKGIDDFIQQNTEIKDRINISDKMKEALIRLFISEVLPKINNSFSVSFDSISSLSNGFSKKELIINLKFENSEFIIGVDKNHTLELREINVNFETIVNVLDKIEVNNNYVFYENVLTILYGKNNEGIKSYSLSNIYFIAVFYNDIYKELGNVYFLPASRSGLYNALSAFGAIFAELSQSRSFLRSKIELPSIAEPVSDYFLNLSSIKMNGKDNSDLSVIANKIEESILKGEVLFNSKTKKLSYSPNKLDINLDLSFTSSMISEIAPIVAHLKYIIKQDNKKQSLLFIEEPEAHLHPKIQVELMKLFVLLSKSGVKVIVTSHSNYLFNKLSNLILAKEIDTDSVEVYHFKMGDNGSYVDKNSMKIEAEGIEDANFSEIAEELYAERLELYENLEL